jgi:hypothetical protein
VSDAPTVAGSAHGCTIRVIPTDTDYIQITAEYEGNTTETTSVPKNRWVARSGLKEYAIDITDQLDIEYEIVHEVLNDIRTQALLAWNWKTFMQKGATTAPSYEHIKSLTVSDDQTGYYPTTGELRDTLHESVENAMMKCLYYAFASPTGIGKSFKMSATPWLTIPIVTGGRQVFHLSPTTQARFDAVKQSKKNGCSHYVLRGRDEACPICRGDHDPDGDEKTITVDNEPVSKWIAKICNQKGLSLHDAKAILLDVADQDIDYIPCGGEDTKCPVSQQWDDVSDSIDGEPEYDVIHATHKFSFVPTLRQKNNVAFDEQPSFAEIGPGDPSGGLQDEDGLDTNRVKDAVNAFLDDADADVETAGELMSVAKREAADTEFNELRDEFPDIYDLFTHRPDREWYYKHPDAHTEARAFTELLWTAARQPSDDNGRRYAGMRHEPPSFTKTSNDDDVVNIHRVSLVINGDNKITTLRIAPDMSNARSVIGFDAHPVEELWKLSVGDAMTVETLMSEEERRLWRRYERRLLVTQVGSGAYSYTTDKRYDVEKNRVLIETLREQYGEHFRTAIAPGAVEDHVEDALADAGVEDPETMHHGDVQSRNDFQGERIGAQIGCIDPGDDYVLDLLAELDMDATVERQDTVCDTCSGDGCDQCNQTGYERAFGRGFIGQDSDTAGRLLASVRENELAQAIGRYARKADDPDDWAAVFVRTTAVPDNMVDFEGPWVWKHQEKQKAVADYFQNSTSGTAKGIKEWIDSEYDDIDSCSKKHVAETCDRHVEAGNIEKHEFAGYNGAHLYEWTATESVSKNGELKFEITEVDHSEEQASTETLKDGVEALRSD